MDARQLSLFKGKRQTGVKPTGPTEFQIHCAVADTLRVGLAPGWMWMHPANGELRNIATAGRLKRMGVKPGASDILLHKAPHAQLHALELKRKGENPSHVQLMYMSDVKAIGGKADWADSVDGALDVLKGWGALRETVHI